MFPLGTVLFPGMILPLHVFEPRYRALTGWCLEHDGRFGVVLIERGSEVGGGDTRHDVGTQARIVQSAALPDGRWVLAAVGERRIRVDRWLGEEPFPRADVTVLDEDEAPADVAPLQERLARVVALRTELGEWPPDDPVPRAGLWELCGLFGPLDGQRLLAAGTTDERVRLLTALLDDEIELLALRATGG